MASQVLFRSLTVDLKARMSKAQGIKLKWNEVCSPILLTTVGAHADAVGAPKEYIIFPLLTVSAAFMGINARISINDEWREPAILWQLKKAKREKKTAAMKRLLSTVEVSQILYTLYL